MIVNFIASGGAGKSAIIKELLKFNDIAFHRPVSYTSRPARAGEIDGIDYHFRSKKEILNMVDVIAVHETLEGHVYADSLSTLKDEKKILLTTFRPEGVKELELVVSNILVVHLVVDEAERMRRMISRGDSKTDVMKRILRDQTESAELDNIKLRSPQVHIDCTKPLVSVVQEIVKVISAQRTW